MLLEYYYVTEFSRNCAQVADNRVVLAVVIWRPGRVPSGSSEF